MTDVRLERSDGFAYREALPEGGAEAPVALLVHGFPESSYMWAGVMPHLAAAGWRAVAPDLPGYGDTPADPPGTWEHHVENLERFRAGLGLDRVALVLHDWGGLIGLRWACDHRGAVSALVVSSTGFFADAKWHALATTLRTEGEGEQLLENLTPEVFASVMRQSAPSMTDEAIAEYLKVTADADRRQGALDLYRSGDFEKLEAYEGCLAELGVPALVLWGGKDEFAPIASAKRFEREIPGSELVVLDEAGHFLVDEDPDRVGSEIARFLGGVEG